MTGLQKKLVKIIEAFLKNRGKPYENSDIIATQRSLDDYYWAKALKIIEEKAPDKDKEIDLNDHERLLVNIGLIHRDLVGGSDDDYENMLFETNLKSFSKNIFYLSEWLQYRWNLDSSMAKIKIDKLTSEMGFRKKDDYKSYDKVRQSSFAKLKHIAVSIPGINAQIFETLKSSRLIYYMEDEVYTRVVQGSELMIEEKNMAAFFQKFLAQLQQRCLTQVLKGAWFDFTINHKAAMEFVEDYASESKDEIKMVEDEIESHGLLSSDHMCQNVKLMKSLYNLGVTRSGTTRCFSPLFINDERCTKTKIVRLLNLLQEVDPCLPGPPDILIAPYAGEGFFEWDRNTLVMPITSESNLENTFVHAIAKYRMLTDAMNFDNHLKDAWDHQFGKGDFKENFATAYNAWVLGVGLGNLNVMAGQKQHKFFVEHIGPNPRDGIVPVELLSLNHEQQLERIKECRVKINGGEKSFETLYHMATLNWRRHNHSDAYNYMEQAHNLDPSNQEVHFSLAFLGQQFKREISKEMYADIIKLYPRSIWKVYAQHQLASYKQ